MPRAAPAGGDSGPFCAILDGGAAIHFMDQGAAERPALVFVNSLGTDFRIWDGVVARLGRRFRMLRYDKRGHGLSDIGRAPYTIDDHVADLAALLDRRRVARATLVGLSVGGQIALGLAARRPDLVQALVLLDTAHRIGTPETWNARIAAVEAGGLESIADAVLERWLSPGYRRDHADIVALWRNMLTRTPARGYAGTCMALRDADLTAAAASIEVPTLCLCGALDLATPPDLVRAMAALIPGAAFRLIPGAGHLPCIEEPATVADLLCRFSKS
jgi:3-oxoadipate enol-lactonase